MKSENIMAKKSYLMLVIVVSCVGME